MKQVRWAATAAMTWCVVMALPGCELGDGTENSAPVDSLLQASRVPPPPDPWESYDDLTFQQFRNEAFEPCVAEEWIVADTVPGIAAGDTVEVTVYYKNRDGVEESMTEFVVTDAARAFSVTFWVPCGSTRDGYEVRRVVPQPPKPRPAPPGSMELPDGSVIL